MLALHDLLELGGGILVADLLEFLQRHGELGILVLVRGLPVLLAADLLRAGWWGLGFGFRFLGRILHIAEGVLVLFLLPLWILLLPVLLFLVFLFVGSLLILVLLLVFLVLLLLLILFLLILLLFVLVLFLLRRRLLLLEQLLKVCAQLGPVGGLGVELFAEIDGLQGVADDGFLRVLLGGLEAFAVG
ncbi:MAG: hypothetical protein HYV75_02840, partial [Opitutae bacterium]|nr:hypothetical protein [Opitutae bacterium]